ncbi:MAG: NADH:ubiquinone oxidoreductase [Phycisphaerae bacterium]
MNTPEITVCPPGADVSGTPAERAGVKPTVAVFSLTSCEGCSLSILELEDELLDILGRFEIVNFREAMSERSWEIDVGFVDGAVSTPDDENEIRHFRECCKTLVAIGACACLGGVNSLKHHQPADEYPRYVYGERADWFPTGDARPLSSLVKVDYEIPGCPINRAEFLRFLKCLLAGRPFRLPTDPVCVECKARGNLCLYEQGEICLGPVTRAGCEAICPSFGAPCEACRGTLGDESLTAAAVNMRQNYQVPMDEVLRRFRTYGAFQGKHLPGDA